MGIMGTLAVFLVDHWRLGLGVAAVGFVLALAYLAAEYLVLLA